jgi:phosphoribosylamine--glycine ligase
VSHLVIVGSGAREHALAHALRTTHDVTVVPGNDGMAAHGISCVDVPLTEIVADLVVIGPEAPLVAGVADELRARGIPVVGPGAAGAQLEGSKAYLKEFLAAAGVPTARYGTFRSVPEAVAFLDEMVPPYVIKTDGLAAGKGVLVTDSYDAAVADLTEKLSGASFGDAGTTVVIEEGLAGIECSLLALCDGENIVPLVPAQDFKRVGEGDTGPNTGGMGAYAPMAVSPQLVNQIVGLILRPTVTELRRRGIDFRGVLYAGLMLTARGPMLIEYNVRFGDPEAEVLASLYGSSLGELLHATATGTLAAAPIPAGASVTVILASEGYPASSRSGVSISGLGPDGQLAQPMENVTVFHAGTRQRSDGLFETHGGRVLAITAVADTLVCARELAYAAAATVTFEGQVWREDIAATAVKGAS